MKIGHFIHGNIQVSETFIYDLMIGLRKRSSQLFVISGASGGNAAQNVSASYTGFYCRSVFVMFVLDKLQVLLGSQGRKIRYEVLQLWAAWHLRKYRAKLSFLDVAYIDYGTTAALVYRSLLKFNVPYVIHVHGYDVSSAFVDVAYKHAFLDSCRYATNVIAPSYHVKRLMILAGVDSEKIVVIRYGVSGSSIQPMPWSQRLHGRPSIMHLGRLTPKKHPLALLHAFAIVKQAVPDAVLTIIGDGPLLQEVEKRIISLGIEENVQLLGSLDRTKSFPLMNKHWVFAQHSVTSISGDQEGFPNSPVEAALHELPVVSTMHSGIPEGVVDGETGFLVREHDYEEMAQRIIHLIKNPGLAEEMGKKGRLRMLELCNPVERVNKIFGLLVEASLPACKKQLNDEFYFLN